MAIGGLPEANIDGEEGAIFAEINITPLTDIFLLLMIIFIVSGSAAVEKAKSEKEAEQSSGLQVNLPTGESKEIVPGQESVMVAIAADGAMTVNGAVVTEIQLSTIFQKAYLQDKNTQIVLRADTGVAHGLVVKVMEQARRTGLLKLAIATKG